MHSSYPTYRGRFLVTHRNNELIKRAVTEAMGRSRGPRPLRGGHG